MPKLRAILDTLLTARGPDPDRRGWVFNVVLVGAISLDLLMLLVSVLINIFHGWAQADEAQVVIVAAVGLPLFCAVYWLQRSYPSRWWPRLFLFSSLVIVSLSDEIPQVVGGRSTLGFAMPIIGASVLLSPGASFWMAILVTLDLLGLATFAHLDESYYASIVIQLLEYLMVALLGWLSAYSLRRALAEVRQTNVDLDRRVQDRTRDLTQALAQNGAVLESIEDGVIVFDLDGMATIANPSAASILGAPIVGQPLEALSAVVPADERSDMLHLFATRQHQPGLRLTWGPQRVLSLSLAPIRLDPADEPTGMVAVYRDITREADLERLRSRLMTMVTHDLRTPLVALMSIVELLQAGTQGPLTDQQIVAVSRIGINARHLLGLINDLLDQAQIEAGKILSIHPTVFSPAALLDGMQSAINDLVAAKHLELTCQIGPTLPFNLIGDPQRLQQVLTNLIGNSIKFTDRGGIQVEADRLDAGHWCLQVRDTGDGIAPQDQVRMFEPFESAGRGAGNGLGLTVARHLVDQMQGSLELDSQLGQGSTFTITLPLVEPAAEVLS